MSSNWQVEVFYDGECPLCWREIKLLRRLDRKDHIQFTDISDPAFSAASYGMTMQDFMGEIQGRLPDGQWIAGVEVLRRLYAAVGLKPVVALTRWPGISHGLEWGYRVFARNRLRLTGRCDAGTCKIE